MCDHCAKCPVFKKDVFLMILRMLEIDFLYQIEEDFENQLYHYFELIDMAYLNLRFAFMFSKTIGMLSNFISMTFRFMYVYKLEIKYIFVQLYCCDLTSHVCITILSPQIQAYESCLNTFQNVKQKFPFSINKIKNIYILKIITKVI